MKVAAFVLTLFWFSQLSSAKVKFFGFYDCNEECIDQVQDFANVDWFRVHINDPAQDIKLILYARQRHMKVIPAMFPEYLTQQRDQNDASDRKSWDAWRAAVKPYASDIVAIYPFDEPYWNALKRRSLDKLPLNSAATSVMRDREKGLQIAAERLHDNFPQVPLIYVEAYPLITPSLEVPTGYDLLGFDCYQSFENCHGKSIAEYASIMEKKLRAGQSLVFVPQGFLRVRSGATPSSAENQHLDDLVHKYAQFVRSDSRFLMVLVWSYQRFPQEDGTEFRGAGALGPPAIGLFRGFAHQVLE